MHYGDGSCLLVDDVRLVGRQHAVFSLMDQVVSRDMDTLGRVNRSSP